MSAATSTIYSKSAFALGWAMAWRLATRLLGLGSTLVLVRVLGPGDFGLVALATSLSNAVEQFGWVGVESAIAREKAPERAVYDTGFTINLLRSVLLGAVIAAVAAPAAGFFREPRLLPVLLALALASAVMGAENIGTVDFRRAFAFNREFRYLLWPRLASIGLGIAAALIWRSYWALVVGIVSARVLRVMFSYVVHPFRPRVSFAAWRQLAGYSAWTWVLGVAALLRERTDTIVVGRMLQTVEVGLYSVGFEFAALSYAEITEGLQRPAFSAFVAARHGGIALREPLLRLTGAMALLSVPLGFGMSLVASPLILLVAGDRWLASVPVVQVLALCGPVVVIGTLARTLFNVTGAFRPMAAITGGCGVLRVLLVIGAVRLGGLWGAAVAAACLLVLEGGVFTVLAWRRERVELGAAVSVLWRPVTAGAVMAAGLWGVGLGWASVPGGAVAVGARLTGAVLAGGGLYGGGVLLLWLAAGRPDGAERDALAFVRRRVGRRVSRT